MLEGQVGRGCAVAPVGPHLVRTQVDLFPGVSVPGDVIGIGPDDVDAGSALVDGANAEPQIDRFIAGIGPLATIRGPSSSIWGSHCTESSARSCPLTTTLEASMSVTSSTVSVPSPQATSSSANASAVTTMIARVRYVLSLMDLPLRVGGRGHGPTSPPAATESMTRPQHILSPTHGRRYRAAGIWRRLGPTGRTTHERSGAMRADPPLEHRERTGAGRYASTSASAARTMLLARPITSRSPCSTRSRWSMAASSNDRSLDSASSAAHW